MLGPIDCENPKDFSQYYRGRYFALDPLLVGLSQQVEKGTLIPACYDQIGGSSVALRWWNPVMRTLDSRVTSWEELSHFGKFGHPYLGTIPWKHTYAYLSQYAWRESVKGLGPSKVQVWNPDYNGRFASAVMALFYLKNPESRIPFGRVAFSSAEEFSCVYEIFNKQMYQWQEAMDSLNAGKRLGCNISNKAGLFIIEGEPHIQVSYKSGHVGELIDKSKSLKTSYELELVPGHGHLVEIIKEHVPEFVTVVAK